MRRAANHILRMTDPARIEPDDVPLFANLSTNQALSVIFRPVKWLDVAYESLQRAPRSRRQYRTFTSGATRVEKHCALSIRARRVISPKGNLGHTCALIGVV